MNQQISALFLVPSIDLVFTNNPTIVDKVYVASPFCSTHSPVNFDVKYKTFKQYAYKRTVRNYNCTNFKDVECDLNTVDWDTGVFIRENNEIYDNFSQIYNKILDKHIPTKVITIRPRDKPFMNKSILLKMRKRNRIHTKAKLTNCPNHWQHYRELNNEVISEMFKNTTNKNSHPKYLTKTSHQANGGI